jgi:cell wall-associated NlpC family hydrolase
VTPWGADCSGLVQTAYRLHGLMLPRDAWQQAVRGEDAGTDLRALRAGDLLFFSDRDDAKITHVAVAMGEGTMVHSAVGRGGFAIERIGDRDDLYVERLLSRFKFARRLPAPAR